MKKRPLPAAVNGGHLPRSKGQQRSAASASEQAVRHDDESPFAQMDLTPTQRRFLSTFSVVGRIDRATEISQVGKWSHQGWMKRPNYREAYQRARRMAGDAIESEAIRRAVEGVRRMRFYQGRPIMVPQLDEVGRPVRDEETDEVVMTPYFEFEYSDTLLITLLKGLFPRRYGARSEVKMSVRSGQRVAGKTPQQCIEETLERLHASPFTPVGQRPPRGNASATTASRCGSYPRLAKFKVGTLSKCVPRIGFQPFISESFGTMSNVATPLIKG